MNEHYPFVNPPLPYAYDALEPYIDTQTMCLHHDRHLQTYVNNLNNILKDWPDLQDWSLEKLICKADCLPECIRQAIKNNAGGVYNHIFYFNGMSDLDSRRNAGMLYPAIINDFGSIDNFFQEFKEAALSVFGSGYAWLVMDNNWKLKFVTTANQDTPIVNNLCPIVTIDVWEHAYYLKHYNERAAYIDDWFMVVDWCRANELYQDYISGRN
jgi:Fe-Mn family superoxide dismutase